MALVVNKYKNEYDVYIGRGSRWGNPYKIGPDGDRAEVVEKYKHFLWRKIKAGEVSLEDLIDLDGKRLGCFCAPQACHGDVIVKFIEWAKKELENG